MTRRITLQLSLVLLLGAFTLTTAAKIINLEEQVLSASTGDRLVVHEWGTFTSVSSADGKAQSWSPLIGPSDLPDFVYRSKEARTSPQARCLKCELALVRMETPVLYFYADRETSVSVKVDFPKGRITEWYPKAQQTGAGVNWGKFDVLPGGQVALPVSKGESHYYPARETEAAPLRIADENKIEHEKFLFYRGVGNFELPLKVELFGDQVKVRNFSQSEMAQVILFENRGGRVGWQILNSLANEATMTLPEPGQSIDSLRRDLENILVRQGLYEKEAAAMVKTWRNSWFEEGLRVFYIIPQRATDSILPLRISPAPTELVRVLVGRTEIITPQMEQAIKLSVQKYLEGAAESRAAALKDLQPFGRFAEPVLRQMMNDRSIAQPVWDFMTAATKNFAANGR